MINVTLYTRPGCHLCDQAREDLAALQETHPHRLAEIDIESDPDLHKKYLTEIPVIEAGPYRLKAPFSRQALEMTLGAAADRISHLERIGDPSYQNAVKRGQTITQSDRIYFWLSRRYMLVLNLFLFLYVGLPFLAPALMEIGATGPAQVIYTVYSPLCHQFGFRSFFLFGEQAVYPRAAAEVNGLVTWNQATGLSEADSNEARLEARAYEGDPHVGFKVALCERDVAIYLAMLLFGLVFDATGRRIRGLHWALWILIGIVPIGLDGFSQLFSQLGIPAINALLPYRESTPLLRIITGALFGLATAWFGFPPIEESMRETRQFLVKKFAFGSQGK